MKIQQRTYTSLNGWSESRGSSGRSQLVLLFCSGDLLNQRDLMQDVHAAYPQAEVIGCSTAGEIFGTQVLESALVETAIEFDSTTIRTAEFKLVDASESTAAGEQLARALSYEGLAHVFVLSDGLHVNGSQLVAALAGNLPPGVAITGGLSGDAALFAHTFVHYHGTSIENRVVAIGFYGKQLRVGYGSFGGWDPFGPERLVTKSQGNVLYELDGESALSLYKRYLGPHVEALPASGLRFPLSVRPNLTDVPVVRTILAIDEVNQSMTFAGDIPQGGHARLMRANVDRLVDGATQAARTSIEALEHLEPQLAILISCVGRKLVMQQRTEEEVDGVRSILGDNAIQTGFYSYGEIAPFVHNARCELHNQTMTITLLSEVCP